MNPERKKINIIAAMDQSCLIGICEYGSYSIPWYLPEDLMNFNKITTNINIQHKKYNAIIMGHNTWKTLGNNYKNKKSRLNCIITNNHTPSKFGELYFSDFEAAMTWINSDTDVASIFVIGGESIYKSALLYPNIDNIYITHVLNTLPDYVDVEKKIYFPLSNDLIDLYHKNNIFQEIYKSDIKKESRNGIQYFFVVYKVNPEFNSEIKMFDMDSNQKKNVMSNIITDADKFPEYQYLNLITEIINSGTYKNARNDIIKSIFGHTLKYDLQQGYPLSTLKKSYPKSIFEELMWFIRGETDTKILSDRGIKIWEKNSSRDFLDGRGLYNYQVGDIGPGYGFQMRHYGAEYIDCNTDYTNQGIDQLYECINKIKNDPGSRRNIIDLWNPRDLDKMALPPCHMTYMFSVDLYKDDVNHSNHSDYTGKKGKLNCFLFQRSWDVLLGWNTSTAALLTYILADYCDLDPGTLVHSIADAHIYKTHIDSGNIQKLLVRKPRKMPKLTILNKHDRIEDYQFNDIRIENYYPNPNIEFTMIA